jgi:hypothetical protein
MPQKTGCLAPHWSVVTPQRHPLGSFEQFCTISPSDGEFVQVKVLHGVKEHDPIGMLQIRLAALLEPPQDDSIRVDNRLA